MIIKKNLNHQIQISLVLKIEKNNINIILLIILLKQLNFYSNKIIFL